MCVVRLALLVLVISCSWLQNARSMEMEKIKISVGGGECVSIEDCSNKGDCEPQINNGKGVCNCYQGFTGEQCEKTTTEKPGEVLKDTASSKPKTRSYIKSSENEDETTPSKREFTYDEQSDLLGLDPKVLAAQDQETLIYNGEHKQFLFVSKDYKATGKHNPYMEIRADREGLRNIFTVKAVAGQADTYTIFNVEQSKYVYISNSKSGFIGNWYKNVLASDAIPTTDDKKKYWFEFKDDDGDGFYIIKSKTEDLILYVSSQRNGIPSNRMVKAMSERDARRETSQFWQFSLKNKVREVNFKAEDGGKEKMDPKTETDSEQSGKGCNKAEKAKEDKDVDFSMNYVDESTNTITFTKTNGFTFTGSLNIATTPVGGSLGFTYTNTKTTAESKTMKTSTTKTVGLKLAPQRCACVDIVYKTYKYTQPFVLEAKTREGKTLIAKGIIEGTKKSEFQATVKMFDYKDNFKCPNEI